MTARRRRGARLALRDIPRSFPVRPLRSGALVRLEDVRTCGDCGLSWDDSVATAYTPAPSARCPFEAFHRDDGGSGDGDVVPVLVHALRAAQLALNLIPRTRLRGSYGYADSYEVASIVDRALSRYSKTKDEGRRMTGGGSMDVSTRDRTLIYNALLEKADGDRQAAARVACPCIEEEENEQNEEGRLALARTLREQADRAERLAEEYL